MTEGMTGFEINGREREAQNCTAKRQCSVFVCCSGTFERTNVIQAVQNDVSLAGPAYNPDTSLFDRLGMRHKNQLFLQMGP